MSNNQIPKNTNFNTLELPKDARKKIYLRKNFSMRPSTIELLNKIGQSDIQFRYPNEVIEKALEEYSKTHNNS